MRSPAHNKQCSHAIGRQCGNSASRPLTTPRPWRPRAPSCASASSASQQQPASAQSLKAQLRQTITRLNSSSTAWSAADEAQFCLLIDQLTALNPTPQPEASPLIEGRWALLFTLTTSNGAGRGPPEAANALIRPLQVLTDGAVELAYRAVRQFLPLLAGTATGKRGSLGLPATPGAQGDGASAAGGGGDLASGGGSRTLGQSRGNFQTINLRTGELSNEARFEVLGTPCCITVGGFSKVVPAAPRSSSVKSTGGLRRGGASPTRLRAMFTSFTISVDGQERVTLPLAAPNLLNLGGEPLGPVGYLETLYLDEQMRIGLGNAGGLFVTVKDDPPLLKAPSA